jgi:hypothetical protein
MPPATAAIILNWKRPQNIGRLVRAVGDALPAAAIFVIDHGEGADSLERRADVPRERCWIRSQPNAGAGARIALAAALPFDHYLCIDDDTFLSGEQIRALMEQLAEAPGSAHGLTGQLIFKTDTGYALRNSVRGNGEISVINQVYAFTKARAEATIRLAAAIGIRNWRDVRRGDDMLLSSAGPDPARIHDFGDWEECPTNDADGIATCRSADFRETRAELYRKLTAQRALFVGNSPVPTLP